MATSTLCINTVDTTVATHISVWLDSLIFFMKNLINNLRITQRNERSPYNMHVRPKAG